MLWLSVDGDRRSDAAALAKLRCTATVVNAVNSANSFPRILVFRIRKWLPRQRHYASPPHRPCGITGIVGLVLRLYLRGSPATPHPEGVAAGPDPGS